jgi:hypothetical protein
LGANLVLPFMQINQIWEDERWVICCLLAWWSSWIDDLLQCGFAFLAWWRLAAHELMIFFNAVLLCLLDEG